MSKERPCELQTQGPRLACRLSNDLASGFDLSIDASISDRQILARHCGLQESLLVTSSASKSGNDRASPSDFNFEPCKDVTLYLQSPFCLIPLLPTQTLGFSSEPMCLALCLKPPRLLPRVDVDCREEFIEFMLTESANICKGVSVYRRPEFRLVGTDTGDATFLGQFWYPLDRRLRVICTASRK